MQGKVTAARLNVREKPDPSATKLGILSQNTIIDVICKNDEWLEITFDHEPAYVAAEFVELIDTPPTTTTGTVTAVKINVREKPNTKSKVVTTLDSGTQLTIRNLNQGWYEILYHGVPAYVSAKYVSTMSPEESGTAKATSQAETNSVAQTVAIASIALAPNVKFKVIGNDATKKVATTWNQYGGLINTLAEQYQIDPACIIALLCVESSGDGFRSDNQGRMVIRFENHKFWSFWGKQHADEFNQYFKLNLADKPWLGHQWRPSPNEEWLDFHGNQAREWQVLEFARGLDDTAALKSISMGAPQIMGFNYAQLDYPSVQAMFEKFSSDIRFQILGLLQFLSTDMIAALRKLDLTRFAGYYNGSGQQQQYGQWIDDHYQAFKTLAANINE